MNHTKLRLSSALFIALFAVPAMGAGDPTAMGPLPPMQTQGSVTYITGGVGQEEVDAMRVEAARFPLSMEFARNAKPNAEFLSGVNVIIRDQRGQTVLSTVTDGPILLVRIPPGKYTVTAEIGGQVKQQSVMVAERKPERIGFEW